MKRHFVLAVAVCLFASFAQASIIPWASGTFTNVPDFFNFAHNGVSPDGLRHFHIDIELTVGLPVFASTVMCGPVVCFTETINPLVVMADGLRRNVPGHADLQNWFPPLPPDHHYFYVYNGSIRSPGGLVTTILGQETDTLAAGTSNQISFQTVAPEPGTLLLLGFSLIGLKWNLKKRQV